MHSTTSLLIFTSLTVLISAYLCQNIIAVTLAKVNRVKQYIDDSLPVLLEKSGNLVWSGKWHVASLRVPFSVC